MADSKRQLSVDEALVIVGEFGLGQKIQVSLAAVAWALAAAHTILVVFAGLGTDPVKSRLVECVGSGECEAVLAGTSPLCALPREAWEWRSKGFSLVTEFDLVCGHAWLALFSAACFFAGTLAGCMVWQVLSERFSRRRLLYTACAIAGVAGCMAATSAALWTHLLFRAVGGAGVGGMCLAAFHLSADLLGPSWRPLAGLMLQGGFSVGALGGTLAAWAVPGWRWLTLTFSLLTLVYAASWSLVVESPHWLLLRGRKGEATAALAALAFANRTRPPEYPLADPTALLANPHRGMADVLRNGHLRRRAALLAGAWCAAAAAYFGVMLLTEGLSSGAPGGDGSTLEVAFTGFAYELPGVAAAALSVERLGRKYTALAALTQAGGSLIAAALTPLDAQRALAVAARFGLSAALASLTVLSWELFPVVVQHPGMVLVGYAARLGAVASPSLALVALQLHSNMVALLVAGSLCLGACVLVAALPETLGAPVHETIADAAVAVKRHRSWAHALRGVFRPPVHPPAPQLLLNDPGRSV